MSKVRGWLFLDDKKTRLRFVEDGVTSANNKNLEWNRLLIAGCLESFVQKFKAVATKEGPLAGWRIDADYDELHEWLQSQGKQEA